MTWATPRNKQAIKINWQFSVKQAREILNSQYVKVNPINSDYKKT